MGRHYWTGASVRDLNAIYEYIAPHDVSAAVRLLDEFDRKAELYAGNPLLGETCPDAGKDLRVFRVGRYVLHYKPYRDGIAIVRVVHASRDVPRPFDDREE